MKTALGAVFALLLFCGEAQARDAFDRVRCGADNRLALVDKALPSGTIVEIEGRHKAVNLEDLGADEITNRLQMISWRICGGEYELLVDATDIIRDVLPFPPHSRSEPEFGGSCQVNGRVVPGYFVAILDNKRRASTNADSHYSPGDATLLSAEMAWKIDEKRATFVKVDATTLGCARYGINSVDGGP